MTDMRYENGTWLVDDISDFWSGNMNDLLQYGQPYSPYTPQFDHSMPFSPDISLTFLQTDVMQNGYGASISASSFPIVQQWVNGEHDVGSGIFHFPDLVAAGTVDSRDRIISAHLYPFPGNISSGDIPPVEAAYIHGSVGFALMEDTTFYRLAGYSWVVAEIGALSDNFDYESSRIPPALNAMVSVLLGPDEISVNLPIPILFSGDGKVSSSGVGAAVSGAISAASSLISDTLTSAVSLAAGWINNTTGESGSSGGMDGGSGSGAGATGGDTITTGNELSVDAGIVAPVANPPGTWSGGGTGTPNPGLPINPDYVGIQPIILDLDGDGVEVNAAANVDFDWDGDGFLESGNWAAADDGFLVVDLEADGSIGANGGDGVIDQGREIAFSQWMDGDVTDLQALSGQVGFHYFPLAA